MTEFFHRKWNEDYSLIPTIANLTTEEREKYKKLAWEIYKQMNYQEGFDNGRKSAKEDIIYKVRYEGMKLDDIVKFCWKR